MNTRKGRQKWFVVMHPDAFLTRRDAINLINRHAEKQLADLSDAQINAELPEAWRREHHQRDLFRDASVEPPKNRGLKFFQSFWRRFLLRES